MARNETPKVYIVPPHNPSSNHSEYGSEARAYVPAVLLTSEDYADDEV